MPVLPNSVLPGATGGSPNILNQIGSAVTSSFSGAVGLSPAATRQNVADMFKYSDKTAGPSPRLIFPQATNDWRVRVSLAPNSQYFYNDPNGNNILSPLMSENANGISGAIGSARKSRVVRRVARNSEND